MKIVSYNINSSSQEKINKLFKMNADVYVVPEIACREQIELHPDYEMKWNSFCTTKGLGVIWKKGKGIFLENKYTDKLSYAIPIAYDDILIIGIWPTKKPDEKTNYTKIATEIIEYYTPLIQQYEKCIITGDFNLFKSKDADIVRIDTMLNKLGLKSVYHSKTGEAFGSESKVTYYHKPMNNKPFFLDYTYTKMPVQNYELLEWDKETSDHVCQVIEV